NWKGGWYSSDPTLAQADWRHESQAIKWDNLRAALDKTASTSVSSAGSKLFQRGLGARYEETNVGISGGRRRICDARCGAGPINLQGLRRPAKGVRKELRRSDLQDGLSNVHEILQKEEVVTPTPLGRIVRMFYATWRSAGVTTVYLSSGPSSGSSS